MSQCAICGVPGADQLSADYPTGLLCRACKKPPSYCDFCRVPRRAWFYPAAEFSVIPAGGLPKFTSTGAGWDACQQCHGLIEAGNYEVLARRSQNYPGDPVELVFMLNFIKAFFLARLGPAEAIS